MYSSYFLHSSFSFSLFSRSSLEKHEKNFHNKCGTKSCIIYKFKMISITKETKLFYLHKLIPINEIKKKNMNLESGSLETSLKNKFIVCIILLVKTYQKKLILENFLKFGWKLCDRTFNLRTEKSKLYQIFDKKLNFLNSLLIN